MHPVHSRQLDDATLRRVFGCFPSGVIAVCASIDGEPVGMAASSFTTVSVAPPLVSICVQNTSTTWPRLRGRERLGVSVLAEHHSDACLSLSRKVGDRFAGVRWTELSKGVVFVHGATAWLDCRLHSELPAGDHTIALLEICELSADPDTPPLVFHGSRFRRLAVAATAGERG
ncbi:flavin reductase family protein [Mycolicibacterium tusciae]|uniref:Flavin reductase n=1 Tax=Mycolicibacterium tusciae TaxID=75922 RepID=A0A1X0JTD2_9MYCO|nr:flavin reductase family protein [Mycolicibacterium tusciae]ORB66002.1 flavin reductase [Mycolicibacterium tusciae]